MPTEVRRLVFAHAETTQALHAYGDKNGVTFAKGKVIRAKFGHDSDFEFHTMRDHAQEIQQTYNVLEKRKSVIVTIFDDATLEHKYYNLTADFVALALIEYCIAQKIILPKEATKELDITEFNICLDIHMNTTTDGSAPILALE